MPLICRIWRDSSVRWKLLTAKPSRDWAHEESSQLCPTRLNPGTPGAWPLLPHFFLLRVGAGDFLYGLWDWTVCPSRLILMHRLWRPQFCPAQMVPAGPWSSAEVVKGPIKPMLPAVAATGPFCFPKHGGSSYVGTYQQTKPGTPTSWTLLDSSLSECLLFCMCVHVTIDYIYMRAQPEPMYIFQVRDRQLSCAHTHTERDMDICIDIYIYILYIQWW